MKSNLYSRMRKKSWKSDLFSTICFSAFVAVSVAMISLTAMLFSNLTGAINQLMNIAKTPDYLQMHTGEFDKTELENFVNDTDVISDYQVLTFLNLDNSILSINGKSLLDSTQDNGLCIQGNGFDYMMDRNNQLPVVMPGQIYVPVCYESVYEVEIGDVMQIGNEELSVAGFIRDSQMNSMMASSKRFLVCEEDFERLKSLGSEEYLIEFLLEEGTDTNTFKTAYENAALPMNGPTITRPLIKMMNTLSDGIMIFIILLISLLILIISLVCIRFMLLTRVVSEASEVGIMKAIGISRKDIRSMFLSRYLVLVLVGVIVGVGLSAIMFQPLSAQMQKLYGVSANVIEKYLYAVIGGGMIGGAIILFILQILKKLNNQTAIKALTGAVCTEKKKSNKLCITLITMIAVFLMMIPSNLYTTLSSPEFITYMGIGKADFRMDLRESSNSAQQFKNLENMLANDNEITAYALYQTCSTPVRLQDNTVMNLLMEYGNHTLFPVTYHKGAAPQKDTEVALSYLLSEELHLYPGDSLFVNQNGEYKLCTISGIYSDITNGGKTAKIYLENTDELFEQNVMWRIAYVNVKDSWNMKQVMEKYAASGAEVVDIASRVTATYGPTLAQIQRADVLVKLICATIIFLVIMLFVRMILANQRKQISIKKALGFKTSDISKSFRLSCTKYILAGILSGSMLGCILGEKICGLALSSLGAVGFTFEINILSVVINILVGSITALVAVYFGSKEIEKIKAIECCRE